MAESVKKTNTISKLQLEVESHLATIAECEARRREDETIRRREDETIRRREDETIRRREDETIRRQFHNVIQELKGWLGWNGSCVGFFPKYSQLASRNFMKYLWEKYLW